MAATLPNLSQLPLNTAHDGAFEELTSEEIALLSEEDRKEYEKHRVKHEKPKERKIKIYRG